MILKIKNKISYEYIIILIFSVLFSFTMFFITPFYDSTYQDIDSYVFRNCAYFIDQGLIVYKDFLDNKGPMLHLFNYLFYKFNFINLLYIASLIIIYINNIYIYKIANIYLKKNLSLLVVFIVNGFFFFITSQYGFNITNNMSEFFAIPLFTYVYYKYISVKEWKALDIITSGICFSILFLLRANLACINVICFLFIIYKYIKEKNYNSIIKYTYLYLIGSLLIIIPTLLYFIYNNALINLIKDYLGFNMLYSSYGAKVSFIGGGFFGFVVRCAINFIKFSLNPYIIFILVFYIIYFIYCIKKKINFSFKYIGEFLIFIFCYALSIFVSNRFHMHYIWIMLCLLVFPICSIINKIDENKLFIILYRILFIISVIYYALGLKAHIDLKIKDTGFNKEYILVKEYIKNNVKINDTVFASINAKNDLYYTTKTLPGNRYIYQYFYEYFYQSNLMDDFMNTMVDNPPSKIIYEKKENNNKADDMIILICALEYDVEYENNKYIIYKKK